VSDAAHDLKRLGSVDGTREVNFPARPLNPAGFRAAEHVGGSAPDGMQHAGPDALGPLGRSTMVRYYGWTIGQ
jgi:hypothetical protein